MTQGGSINLVLRYLEKFYILLMLELSNKLLKMHRDSSHEVLC